MKVLVIYNPAAGGGRERALQRLHQALLARGAEVEIHRTTAPGDATEFLRSRVAPVDVVVAVGGDGTTNEVINGLAQGVPLAIMATGTANVLARELGLPSAPDKVAQLVVDGQTLTVWPGRLNGRRFLMWVGIGYDAWVVNATDLALKQRIGKGAYMVAMLSQIARYGRQRFRLTLDGRPYDCYSAIVANARYYGGSFILSREANITEPGLQVLLFQKPGRWTLIKCVLALLVGRMESMDGVQSLRVRTLEADAVDGEPLQADGDPAGLLPARVEVDALSLPVKVPVATLRAFGKA